MTASAIVFMSVTWTLVTGLATYCMWRIMRKPKV
jgi:hypothetical protein